MMTQPSEKIDLFLGEFIDTVMRDSRSHEQPIPTVHLDELLQPLGKLCQLCGFDGYLTKFVGPDVFDITARLSDLIYGRFQPAGYSNDVLCAVFKLNYWECQQQAEHFHFMWKLRALNELLQDDPA